MVKIRLTRMGYKKHPVYRVVVLILVQVATGSVIEQLGSYDPNQEPSLFNVDADVAKKWLANGAQPTETVARLFKQAGITK